MKTDLTLAELEKSLPQDKRSARQRKQGYVRYRVADLLQTLRTQAGLTQSHVARLADLSQPEISRLERASGSRAPCLWTLVLYAESCGFEVTVTATALNEKNKSEPVTASMTLASLRRRATRRRG